MIKDIAVDELEKIEDSDIEELIDFIGEGAYGDTDTLEDFISSTSLEDSFIDKLNSDTYLEYSEWFEDFEEDFIKCGTDITRNKEIIEYELSKLKEDKKILIVLDKMLCSKDHESNDLLGKYLKYIAEKIEKGSGLLLVMFSSQPEELYNYQMVLEYLKDKDLKDKAPLLSLHINFVDKNAKENRANFFIEAAMKSFKASYIENYQEIFNTSFSALKKKMWNLNKNQALFYYDYLSEGQQIDEIIYEMYQSKFEREYYHRMEDSYSALINPIRKSLQRKFDSSGMSEEKILFYRFQKEFSNTIDVESDILPTLCSSDISYGDIISIGDNKYMVISQACDSTVRHDGTRATNSFQLIKLKEKKDGIIDVKWLVNYVNEFISKSRYAGKNADLILKNKKDVEKLLSKCFDREDIHDFIKICEKSNGKKLKCKNTKDKESKKLPAEYRIDNNAEIFNVETLWLDALLLPANTNGDIVLSKKSIKSAHELRFSVKKMLMKKYDEFIERVEESGVDEVEGMINFSLGNLGLKIEFRDLKDDSKDDSNEVILKNIKREGRMRYLVAKKLYDETVTKLGRIPIPFKNII